MLSMGLTLTFNDFKEVCRASFNPPDVSNIESLDAVQSLVKLRVPQVVFPIFFDKQADWQYLLIYYAYLLKNTAICSV